MRSFVLSNVPTDLQYTEDHVWVRTLSDDTVEIGITDHAQQVLGDIVRVGLPETGRTLKQGEACAVVESAKAASDVCSPVAGDVMAGNPQLANEPEAVNSDAYGNWLMRVRPAQGALAAVRLLSAAQYAKVLKAQGG
jgi:glycine cleavage system H protein